MEKRHLKESKHWNLEPVHYVLFWIALYILIATFVGCSPNNGIVKSKCYDSKWHVNN
jgi:hypothetical protein